VKDEEVQDWVKAARQGDKLAFERLYDCYVESIYKYLFFRLGHVEEAEDLTSQVFLKAFKAISQYESRGAPFSSWLFRIAHNLVIDHYRKNNRYRIESLENEEWEIEETRLEPEKHVLALADCLEVKDALLLLTAAQREVLVLRYLEGFKVAEIAQIVGKKEGAVRALLRRGLASLAKIWRHKSPAHNSSSKLYQSEASSRLNT
jgi:RNA polymerase sigma-70 factor (ECF subfamily)